MSLLFESIACLNGQLQNLSWHQARVDRSQAELLKIDKAIALDGIRVPPASSVGLWKCRVSYGAGISKIELTPYRPAQTKTYQLVKADVTYSYKLEDRQDLNQLFAKRGQADDVIIIVNDQLTDSSYGNIIFHNGVDWFTSDTPLLRGTMRERLLHEGKIKETGIGPSDLARFQKFMMINALNPFAEERALPISAILS